ncbi:MAG: carboxylating nicotinate-nucleotide diphosphorylase [Gemmatimonadota bacterium]
MLAPVALAADALRVARMALAEDGDRDITSEVCIAAAQDGEAVIEAREECVLAGRIYADSVVELCGLPRVRWNAADGERVPTGSVLGTVAGPLRALLRAERPLLNLLQRAAGIATMTAQYRDAVAGSGCQVLHTRKTTPGLRIFEVHAVLLGGGALHRLDLASTVMVKDNHWQALHQGGRTLATALAEAREHGVESLQVEVESLHQVEEACRAGATRLLIDNQSPGTVRHWGAVARDLAAGIEIEATGGITLSTVAAYAGAGADFVSTGALTHSVRSIDLGVEVR